MKNILLVLSIILATACCGSKKSTSAVSPTPQSQTAPINEEATTVKKDTLIVKNPAAADVLVKLPACINELINKFKAEKVQNPPRKIISYQYNSQQVYYVPAICCDFYSDLYDSKCNLIGHPDGGITGKGDGKFPGFSAAVSYEKIVWADLRKQ